MNQNTDMRSRVEAYLAYRRKLGYRLKVEGQMLLNFARYADETAHGQPLTTDLALSWAKLPEEASRLYWARRLEVVRCFAKHLGIFEPRTEIPGNRILGPAHRRIQPYIYSQSETERLHAAARALLPVGGLRPRTYATLIGLLASTGLRPSEAFNLRSDDADLAKGILTIRKTKFHKTRLVPLHTTATRALRDYVRFRNGYVAKLDPAGVLLLGEGGAPPSRSTVYYTFRQLCAVSAIRRTDGIERTPRLYDLRHTFACRRLIAWHQERIDVDHAIAALSTYLGHVKVTDTYWYLTGIPELFTVTGAKFERYACRKGGSGR